MWPSNLLYVMLSGRNWWWISIRSVNNTQDWRKFWKRSRGCFLFQSLYQRKRWYLFINFFKKYNERLTRTALGCQDENLGAFRHGVWLSVLVLLHCFKQRTTMSSSPCPGLLKCSVTGKPGGFLVMARRYGSDFVAIELFSFAVSELWSTGC